MSHQSIPAGGSCNYFGYATAEGLLIFALHLGHGLAMFCCSGGCGTSPALLQMGLHDPADVTR